MKIAAAVFAICMVATVSGFAPAFTRGAVNTPLYSEPEKEQEGLDLDLGEMFSMWVLVFFACNCLHSSLTNGRYHLFLDQV